MRNYLLKFIDTNKGFHECGIGDNVRLHILQKRNPESYGKYRSSETSECDSKKETRRQI